MGSEYSINVYVLWCRRESAPQIIEIKILFKRRSRGIGHAIKRGIFGTAAQFIHFCYHKGVDDLSLDELLVSV